MSGVSFFAEASEAVATLLQFADELAQVLAVELVGACLYRAEVEEHDVPVKSFALLKREDVAVYGSRRAVVLHVVSANVIHVVV